MTKSFGQGRLEDLRQAAHDLGTTFKKQGTPAAARAFYKGLADLFRTYLEKANWEPLTGRTIEPIPRAVALSVADFFDYIAVGRMPDQMEVAIRRGRPGVGPDERFDLLVMGAYVVAAQAGVVTSQGEPLDKKPVQTVAEMAGVQPRTARRWARAKDAQKWEPIVGNSAGEISERMRAAAGRYRGSGRGVGALQRRARGKAAADI